MPAIKDRDRVGLLLRSIQSYSGGYVVQSALELLPLLAVRSGEFRNAKWPEFDLDGALWTIPAKHRKLTKEQKEDPSNTHLVPLSTQAVAKLRHLHELTGIGNHVFPSIRGDSRPMSDGTINTAIRALGFDDMVGHGWRTVFSSFLNEAGFNCVYRRSRPLKPVESGHPVEVVNPAGLGLVCGAFFDGQC